MLMYVFNNITEHILNYHINSYFGSNCTHHNNMYDILPVTAYGASVHTFGTKISRLASADIMLHYFPSSKN
jgi:hypothetical protein